MAKPRYIAPWHREGLEEADLEAMNYEATRGYFGPKRRDGARRLRKVESSLCTLRDLQKEAVSVSGSG